MIAQSKALVVILGAAVAIIFVEFLAASISGSITQAMWWGGLLLGGGGGLSERLLRAGERRMAARRVHVVTTSASATVFFALAAVVLSHQTLRGVIQGSICLVLAAVQAKVVVSTLRTTV